MCNKRNTMMRWVVYLLVLLNLGAGSVSGQDVRQVPIDVLVYSYTLDGPSGQVVPAVVGVGPNHTERMRVGFFEEVSLGSGLTWRSAGWMAAVVAAYTLQADLKDYTVYYDIGGMVDGPSAGALMTVAVLAGFQDHTILPHATITGTINPDGTIGPVGGIAQKLEGAAERGKTLVLIPLGQRFEPAGRRQPVDLIAYGRDLGIEVREVGDIYRAYTLLTGESMLAPIADLTAPELSEESFQALQTAYQYWFDDYVALVNQLRVLGAAPSDLVISEAQRAQQALFQGMVAVAYDRMVAAVLGVRIERVTEQIRQELAAGRWDRNERIVAEEARVAERIDAYLEELARLGPDNLGDVAPLLTAYSAGIQAHGCYLLGEQRLLMYGSLVRQAIQQEGPRLGVGLQDASKRPGALVTMIDPDGQAYQAGIRAGDMIIQFDEHSVVSARSLSNLVRSMVPGSYYTAVLRGPDHQESAWVQVDLLVNPESDLYNEAFANLLEGVVFFALADTLLQVGADQYQAGQYTSRFSAPDNLQVQRLGEMLRAGASASMEYLDANVLHERARERGIHPDLFRWQFMHVDYDYALAYANYLATHELGHLSPYALLGSSASLFHDAGSLITKYYSLTARSDEYGTVVSISNERALVHMLNLAANQASATMKAARDMGVEPVLSAVTYEIAQYLREQDLDDKLTALNLFWNASFLARTLVMLADSAEELAEPLPADASRALQFPHTPTQPPAVKELPILTLEGVLLAEDDQLDDETYYHLHYVFARADRLLRVELTSNDFSPYLLLLDPYGDVLAEQGAVEDALEGTVVLERVLPYTGPYHVFVNTVFPGEKGYYELVIHGATLGTP